MMNYKTGTDGRTFLHFNGDNLLAWIVWISTPLKERPGIAFDASLVEDTLVCSPNLNSAEPYYYVLTCDEAGRTYRTVYETTHLPVALDEAKRRAYPDKEAA